MENENYLDLVTEHIELDKTLYNTKPEYREIVKSLLKKKKEIMKKNGFFAQLEIKKINKKIDKYKKIF